ncbi:MAG: peptidoglycan-binding domain-containing protein [Candidatus Omnitrophota bacterium]
MKRTGFLFLAAAISVCLFGCGKKQQALEEMQEPMSIEALSITGTQAQAISPETKIEEHKIRVTSVTTTNSGGEPKLETMPPSGPYSPSTQEVQKALKNAGYYTSDVDGKLGPKTKKAIKEFQKANALAADGKVGPRTWAALSKHLNEVPAKAGTGKTR